MVFPGGLGPGGLEWIPGMDQTKTGCRTFDHAKNRLPVGYSRKGCSLAKVHCFNGCLFSMTVYFPSRRTQTNLRIIGYFEDLNTPVSYRFRALRETNFCGNLFKRSVASTLKVEEKEQRHGRHWRGEMRTASQIV